MPKPNVLFIMTDQQRFDTIDALGNGHIYTPNLDRRVRRGVAFERIHQFDGSRGVSGFPERPGDALEGFPFQRDG